MNKNNNEHSQSTTSASQFESGCSGSPCPTNRGPVEYEVMIEAAKCLVKEGEDVMKRIENSCVRFGETLDKTLGLIHPEAAKSLYKMDLPELPNQHLSSSSSELETMFKRVCNALEQRKSN